MLRSAFGRWSLVQWTDELVLGREEALDQFELARLAGVLHRGDDIVYSVLVADVAVSHTEQRCHSVATERLLPVCLLLSSTVASAEDSTPDSSQQARYGLAE
jgi:hypothetical protein